MSTSSLHDRAVVFDGLVVAKWSRPVFKNMHRGGLTAANCTVCVWEGFRDTMINIARWKTYFADNADLIMPCHSVADIQRAKEVGRVGIVLGWQNTSAIEDRLDVMPLFRDLGVRFVQLTYNSQNYVGSGCWEKRDGGLSVFGEDLIAAMNRLGIVIDLSHVGTRTASDAIAASAKPCAYTHVCPAALLDHPRNKTDAQLREIVERGGFVGTAAYASFLPRGTGSTLDDYLDAIDHMISACGEDNVGIGTDFTEAQDDAFFDWVRMDKGNGRRLVPSTGVTPPTAGFASPADYPALTRAMQARGWPERRVLGVLGENWLKFLDRVW